MYEKVFSNFQSYLVLQPQLLIIEHFDLYKERNCCTREKEFSTISLFLFRQQNIWESIFNLFLDFQVE